MPSFFFFLPFFSTSTLFNTVNTVDNGSKMQHLHYISYWLVFGNHLNSLVQKRQAHSKNKKKPNNVLLFWGFFSFCHTPHLHDVPNTWRERRTAPVPDGNVYRCVSCSEPWAHAWSHMASEWRVGLSCDLVIFHTFLRRKINVEDNRNWT